MHTRLTSHNSIHHPLTNTRSAHPPIIIYLPPGPVLAHFNTSAATPDSIVASTLASNTSATVVQLNYRLSSQHQYPTPIHDVLTGYDWIVRHLAPSWVTRHGATKREKVLKIGVCGSLMGGSLATMLALTECRLGGSRIVAAAVAEPIVDWVFAPPSRSAVDTDLTDEDIVPRAQKRGKAKPVPSHVQHASNPLLPASTLLAARDRFFRSPDAWLDPFASPLLFFRTPGVAPPPVLTSFSPSSTPSSSSREDAETAAPPPRKSPRVYPPTGSGLRLPNMRVTVGEESVLRDQGVEFVKYMRRAVVREGERNGGVGGGGKTEYLDGLRSAGESGEGLGEDGAREGGAARAQAEAEAEKQVVLETVPRVGLWGRSSGDERWRRSIEDVGAWFRGAMG
ncbi:hypothetical protein W97_07851 [Coniosporium apollinis CBS 100218]|uniref:Alpha/beta hydrolase fold-3 domain-containing protein n=1 Tax=Coniosporium apollinis (strain CBS 100218) TaxID=1168221 RepID=R7Z3E1_CONA1|nr:uncharacterized protein W97_07851 [Coniosporium apollinis CBS 100218]EON68593.1 hypothetical protein W97_07851 [Coniosporium apollinis CBS 100218]